VRHPVHDLLAHHGDYGTEPSAAELAELQLAPADRELVRKAARAAAFQYEGGDRGGAVEYAVGRAHEIVAGLSAEQRDPRYLRPDPNEGLAGLSPAELADLIPR
jgi:hypothetical protein